MKTQASQVPPYTVVLCRKRLTLSTDAYEKTKAISPLQADVEQLVPVVLARAGYEKRRVEEGSAGEQGFDTLVEIVMDGVARIRKGRFRRKVSGHVSPYIAASPAGDPRLRVEKFFSGVVSVQDLSHLL